ncbi:DUF3667 domain-containing protein [Spongiivirga citrea]|uniref:DUF3667 domain-containing protein n=1 Tax=Spongiivirga citrea TaxID=1481457 RepID=A0A6M0CFC7_9FLAO|nr:DUF3667 domain-containing protein [Spongiivirga citrea]NER16481.1 DUF3667 domain-containing protein [Spongiivirga citrea]
MRNNFCENCESDIELSHNYCPNCGQITEDDLTVKVLFSNTIANYFSVDARFFRSFIPLVFKPGVLAKRFVNGKRLKYLHPAQFYLFISVVFFFFYSFVQREQQEQFDLALQKGFNSEIKVDSVPSQKLDSIQIQNIMAPLKKNQKVMGIKDEDLKQIDSIIQNADADDFNNFDFEANKEKLDSLIAIDATDEQIYREMGLTDDDSNFRKNMFGKLLKFYKQRGGGLLETFYSTIPIALFFLLPIFAFLLKLMYWKRARYAHHMVFSFYFFTLVFLLLTFFLMISMIVEMDGWWWTLLYLILIIHLFISMKNFYQQGYFKTFLKYVFLGFTFALFILPVTFGVLVFTTLLLY